MIEYKSNNITLYNDDARVVFEKLKNDDISNLIIVSDPPFNVGYHYNEYHDKLPQDIYLELLSDLFGGGIRQWLYITLRIYTH